VITAASSGVLSDSAFRSPTAYHEAELEIVTVAV
jgi:hypothetical protein